eukprot:TRINITY_DN1004_c0_g5_i1.p1 TRINITY_DN1004_c0_g5~~TRINITY_DN1004_c0_g5_i1.p1  ORF type:complete len:400 (-),score=53.96 TRINITY_DN1004_c0_g5_i1:1066-2265(-)
MWAWYALSSDKESATREWERALTYYQALAREAARAGELPEDYELQEDQFVLFHADRGAAIRSDMHRFFELVHRVHLAGGRVLADLGRAAWARAMGAAANFAASDAAFAAHLHDLGVQADVKLWQRTSSGRLGTLFYACWALCAPLKDGQGHAQPLWKYVLNYLQTYTVVTSTSVAKTKVLEQLDDPATATLLEGFSCLWERAVYPLLRFFGSFSKIHLKEAPKEVYAKRLLHLVALKCLQASISGGAQALDIFGNSAMMTRTEKGGFRTQSVFNAPVPQEVTAAEEKALEKLLPPRCRKDGVEKYYPHGKRAKSPLPAPRTATAALLVQDSNPMHNRDVAEIKYTYSRSAHAAFDAHLSNRTHVRSSQCAIARRMRGSFAVRNEPSSAGRSAFVAAVSM